MKTLIGYIGSYSLFYIGHWTALTWQTKINKQGYGFGLYNWCMLTSLKIQDWAGNKKPWTKTKIL